MEVPVGESKEEDKEISVFHPPVLSLVWSRSEVTSATLNTVPVISGPLHGSKIIPCSMAGLLSQPSDDNRSQLLQLPGCLHDTC